MSEKQENKSKVIEAHYLLLEVFEEMRKEIEKVMGSAFAETMGYKQLSEILARKIKGAKISFKFP